jgi:hypothetical protein
MKRNKKPFLTHYQSGVSNVLIIREIPLSGVMVSKQLKLIEYPFTSVVRLFEKCEISCAFKNKRIRANLAQCCEDYLFFTLVSGLCEIFSRQVEFRDF